MAFVERKLWLRFGELSVPSASRKPGKDRRISLIAVVAVVVQKTEAGEWTAWMEKPELE